MNVLGIYIYFLLPLLTSFVFSAGYLNDNSYVKEFALGIVLPCQLFVAFLDKKSWNKISFNLKLADIILLLLLAVYSIFFIPTANNLDFTIPFVYFSSYFFFRIYFQDNTSGGENIITKIVPFIISVHYMIAITQFLHLVPNLDDFFPVGSTFGNPDKLASYLSILLPFCFTKKQPKVADYILLTMGVALFIILQARTALIATIVTFICFLFFKNKISKKTLWIGASICLTGLLLMIWWHPDSVFGRIFIWIVALSMFVSNPRGYGLYASQKEFPEAQANFIASYPTISSCFNIDQVVYSPFNEFLNVGISVGIIGLVLYILFIGFVFRDAYRKKMIFIYPIISFLIISISYFPMKIAPISIVMVMISAIIISSASSKIIINIRFSKVVGMFIFTLVSCCIVLTNHQTFTQWEKAIKETDSATEVSKDVLFFKSYPQLKGNGLFLFSYADYSFQKGNLHKAICLMEKAENYHAGINSSYLLAALYEENGEIEKAEVQLKKAVSLSNGQYNPMYKLIVFLDKAGKSDEAYRLAVGLYNKTQDLAYYADSYIIKKRVKLFIDEYESRMIPE